MSLCENPFMVGNLPAPCGGCDPCIKTRRSKWKNRILFESYDHDYSAFVTLTYATENLRFINEKTGEFTLPTLATYDLRNFLKRIRRAVAPHKLRFYGCGEYGDDDWRPHYHLGLFGYEPCYRGKTDARRHHQGFSCCPPCDLLKEKWGLGRIDNQPLNEKTASYIAGYVTKKLTRHHDTRLDGRFPEFQRMSNRPGLGASFVPALAEALSSGFGQSMLTDEGDVPPYLIQKGKKLHLDRYIRTKLREAVGLDQEQIDEETGEIYIPKEKAMERFKEELLSMYMDEVIDPETKKWRKDAPLNLKSYIQDRDKQKILNMKTLTNIYKKRRNL